MIAHEGNEQKEIMSEEIGAEESDDEEKDSLEIDNSEDLEQRKREINEFNVEGNTAKNQIFVQDIGTGGLTVNNNYYVKGIEPIHQNIPETKHYDLCELEESIEFVEKFHNSEYFSTAIILCVLEAVLLSDLPDLKSKLNSILPTEIKYDETGNVISTNEKNTYIAINSTLAIIGGKKIDDKDRRQCYVSLGENSIQALCNIIEQFPELQDLVINFLLQLTQEENYYTNFYISQIATVFAEMISHNMISTENKLFPVLYTDPSNVYLLGTLAYILYTDKNGKNDAERLILQWIFDKTWLWRAACVVYVLLSENNISVTFENELKKKLSRRISYFRGKDFKFISELLMQSKDLRTLVCEILYTGFKQAKVRNTQMWYVRSYINIVRCSYYRVSSSFVELSLVACDTRQQQDSLGDILSFLMWNYPLRKQLYAVLKAYLKELSHYDISREVVQHIAAYFYNLSFAGEDYCEDIKRFLQECNNKAAQKIANLLYEENDKRGR